MSDADRAACLGAATTPVREFGSHMEECRLCQTCVAFDLVNHRFFGFKAGCERFTFSAQPGHDEAGEGR